MEAAFREHYQRRYGAVLDSPAVLVDLNCRVVGRRAPASPSTVTPESRPWDDAVIETRQVYFADAWLDVPVLERERLAGGMTGTGPAIVEQGDTTAVVHPGTTVRVDGIGNLVLELSL
jgi:N-methylhydantoinase A/oxoprolinase/acetone carboxylase beta subunit